MCETEDWREATDEDGFPVCNEDRANDLFTSRYGVVYACTLTDGLGWGWRQISDPPSGEAHEPPADAR